MNSTETNDFAEKAEWYQLRVKKNSSAANRNLHLCRKRNEQKQTAERIRGSSAAETRRGELMVRRTAPQLER